jgi:hypothetical protein
LKLFPADSANKHGSNLTTDEKLLRAQHTAQGRVGRRVAPESAFEVLSARNDGQQGFSAAY